MQVSLRFTIVDEDAADDAAEEIKIMMMCCTFLHLTVAYTVAINALVVVLLPDYIAVTKCYACLLLTAWLVWLERCCFKLVCLFV